MPELDHHLLCPMQCRVNDVDVNECPRMYCNEPTGESHAIVAYDDNDEKVVIPFFLKGVTSLFNTYPIEADEFDNHMCPRIELTSAQLTWDPSSTILEDQENQTIDYKGEIVRPGMRERKPLMAINQLTTSTCADAVDVMSKDNFVEALESNVNVSHVRIDKPVKVARVSNTPAFGHVKTTKGKMVDAETLAKRWNIDHRKALN